MVWGEGPEGSEDEENRPFDYKGEAGALLHKHFKKHGLHLYRDCIVVNSVDCRPMDSKGNNREPTKKEMQCCFSRKLKAIDKWRPEHILLLGGNAISAFYSFDAHRKDFTAPGVVGMRSMNTPDPKTNAWISHAYHPSFIVRGKKDMENVFSLDIKAFAKFVGCGRPKIKDYSKEIKILTKFKKVVNLLKQVLDEKPLIVIDYETSSYRYYEKIHQLYIISITFDGKTYSFPFDKSKDDEDKPYWKPKQRRIIRNLFRMILANAKIKKVAQNLKHEEQASTNFFNTSVKGWTHDTMIAAHIINESRRTTALKTQAYFNFGAYDYSPPNSIMSAPPKQRNKFDTLSYKQGAIYCGKDTKYTDLLMQKQIPILKKEKLTKAYNLFHEGVQAFADMERHGIKLDMDLLGKLETKWGEQLEKLKDKIFRSKEAKRFEKRMGRPLSFNKKISDTDLRTLLFTIQKFKPLKRTKTTYSVDEETLKSYVDKSKIVSLELKYRKVHKLKNTYLSQFSNLNVDGFIYPSINLHIPRSMRSSSNDPSFHTLPKHDVEMKVIRELIISRFPRQRGFLGEVDYGAMEVRIIACVSKDRALIEYIMSGGDPHGDWAEIIYKVKKRELSPKKFAALRQEVKNQYIFPLFYGSYWRTVARNLKKPKWAKTHIQWEMWIKKCEEKFWKMFSGVRKWQDKVVKVYKKAGFVRDFSWGFKRRGYLVRNKLYNFPIQGPAYHCLQWTINNLWRNNYYNFESLLCCQIHDALFWDMLKKEFKKVKKKVTYIMTEKIREDNPWIIVPLIAEWSTGYNWANMEDVA